MSWTSLIGNVNFSDRAKSVDTFGSGSLFSEAKGIVFQKKNRRIEHSWPEISRVNVSTNRDKFVMVITMNSGQVFEYHCVVDEKTPSDLFAEINKLSAAKEASTRKSSLGLKANVLDGYGWSPSIGSEVKLRVEKSEITFEGATELAKILVQEVTEVKIEGFARTKSAGLTGGGFGAKGAFEGIALASIVNRLTTQTAKWTIVSIRSNDGMTLLLLPETTDIQVRKYFRQVQDEIARQRTAPASKNMADFAGQFERISELYNSGLLTPKEFAAAKLKLLSEE